LALELHRRHHTKHGNANRVALPAKNMRGTKVLRGAES
jgi:hypothetical protein